MTTAKLSKPPTEAPWVSRNKYADPDFPRRAAERIARLEWLLREHLQALTEAEIADLRHDLDQLYDYRAEMIDKGKWV